MTETIQKKMDDVITELTEAKEDEEMGFEHQSYKTLLAYGDHLEAFPSNQRTKENMVDKCTSTVYLVCMKQDGKMHFLADSDAQFVRGELGILFFIFQDCDPKELASEAMHQQFMEFFRKLEGLVPISMNRKRGFVSIFERMSTEARKHM